MNDETARALKFVGEREPDSISALAAKAVTLIDGELASDRNGRSQEDLTVLNELRESLAAYNFDTSLGAYIHASTSITNESQFTLTPQEVEWLARHDQDRWLDYLIHRHKLSLYPARRKLTDFPLHLLLEPTPVCNLRCVMCFQVDKVFSSDRGYMGYMSWNLFVSVIDQAADHRCHSITLASRGEPTLHRRFGDMLSYIKDRGILDTKINTNATILTEKLAHEILSAEVETVAFSVESVSQEAYEKIRVRGKFERVLANIARFNEIRSKHYAGSPTTTRVSGVSVKGADDPEEMRRFWINHVDQVAFVRELPRWDTYQNLLMPSQTVCSYLYERMYVWFDGTCNPCDMDYKSLLSPGNANEHPISDLWLGEKFERLRALHGLRKRSQQVPCDRCPV